MKYFKMALIFAVTMQVVDAVWLVIEHKYYDIKEKLYYTKKKLDNIKG